MHRVCANFGGPSQHGRLPVSVGSFLTSFVTVIVLQIQHASTRTQVHKCTHQLPEFCACNSLCNCVNLNQTACHHRHPHQDAVKEQDLIYPTLNVNPHPKMHVLSHLGLLKVTEVDSRTAEKSRKVLIKTSSDADLHSFLPN
eukprot:m.180760 g.180760  ORF g.180760 m.180760 type:complete len:142 (+) comp14952_c2_seq3:1520-1945(+)